VKSRALLLVLVGYLLCVVQASLQALLPIRLLVPELSLLCALAAGLYAREGIAGSCAVALVLGYVTDLLAGAPKGLHALGFVLLCMAARGASLRLLVRGAVAPALIALCASLLEGGLVAAVRAHSDAGAQPFHLIILQALMTALAAPLVLPALARLDGRASRPSAVGSLS
jgi:rod shape-determining protein MreD